MTKRSDGYVAALVARLGGDVTITDEEAARAPKFSLKRDPQTATVRIWVEPETLVGEIVTAPEPQSIEPLKPVEQYACDEPIWDGPYKMTCSYLIVNDKCVRHGRGSLRRLVASGSNP